MQHTSVLLRNHIVTSIEFTESILVLFYSANG